MTDVFSTNAFSWLFFGVHFLLGCCSPMVFHGFSTAIFKDFHGLFFSNLSDEGC